MLAPGAGDRAAGPTSIGSDRTVISSPTAPAAVGPYSQGIKAGPFIFLSGQIPLDPKTGLIVGATIEEQTERVIQNIIAVLDVVNSGLFQVVKATVFLKDLNDFDGMNRVYSKYFEVNPPARSTIQVARLPKDSLVEIEVIVHNLSRAGASVSGGSML
jgi:2-iminobutanoate/2-iminopropanoate deaminase